MHIGDLQRALHDEAQSLPVPDVTAADIRRRIAASRARALSALTAVLLVVGMVGAVAVNPKPEGGDVTGLVAATGEAGSARFTITGTSTFVVGGGDQPRVTKTVGEGLLDFDGERMQMTTTATATDEEGKQETLEHRLISIGQDHWSSIPEDLRQEEGIEATWFHSRSEAEEESDALAGPAFDPDNVLAAIDDFAERVEREGEEDVRGVATTRYKVIVDYAYLAGENVHSDGTTSTTASPQQMRDAMQLDMKIWIDGTGLLRRMDQTMRSATPSDGSFESTTRMELFDFGVDTSSIQPPPPDQVIEQDEVNRRSTGGSGSSSSDDDGLWEEDLDYAPVPPDSSWSSCAEATPGTTRTETRPDGSVEHRASMTCRAGVVEGDGG